MAYNVIEINNPGSSLVEAFDMLNIEVNLCNYYGNERDKKCAIHVHGYEEEDIDKFENTTEIDFCLANFIGLTDKEKEEYIDTILSKLTMKNLLILNYGNDIINYNNLGYPIKEKYNICTSPDNIAQCLSARKDISLRVEDFLSSDEKYICLPPKKQDIDVDKTVINYFRNKPFIWDGRIRKFRYITPLEWWRIRGFSDITCNIYAVALGFKAKDFMQYANKTVPVQVLSAWIEECLKERD